ncbi:MAG: hypothetical protein ABI602_02040 [Candidatus Saccharibacteria bacterium]
MKLLKTKTPPPSNRQRIMGDRQSSPTAFSYHSRRSELELNTGRQLLRVSKVSAKRFGKFWLQRFGLFILLSVAAISLVSAATLSTNPKIVLVAGSNQQPFLQNQQIYSQAVARQLRASIWNHNKITVNTTRINQQLAAQFPELASASITLPLLSHRPVVYLEPATPAIIFHSSSGSYVLDTTGKVLLGGAIPDAVDKLGLPVLTDQSGLAVAINHQVLRSSDVSFIQTAVGELKAHGYTPSSLVLPAASSELDIQLAAQPYFIKFNLQSEDARQQVGTFLAATAKLKSLKTVPSTYMDVRVNGRAYYK